MEKKQVEAWRRMQPWQKLRVVEELVRASEELARVGIELRHPLASEREIELRLAALRLERETMAARFAWDPYVVDVGDRLGGLPRLGAEQPLLADLYAASAEAWRSGDPFPKLGSEVPMAQGGSVAKWVLAGMAAAAIGGGVGLWLAEQRGPTAPAPIAREPAPAPAAAGAAPAPSGARAPAQRIPEHGRLAVELGALRDGDVLALGLDMPDAARGQGERPVKVVDVGGRVYQTTGASVEGPGTGLRVEIDPGWLRPGRYMIEVSTAEQTPLALRRYVLEVR